MSMNGGSHLRRLGVEEGEAARRVNKETPTGRIVRSTYRTIRRHIALAERSAEAWGSELLGLVGQCVMDWVRSVIPTRPPQRFLVGGTPNPPAWGSAPLQPRGKALVLAGPEDSALGGRLH